MAQSGKPNIVRPERKVKGAALISASEARRITDSAQFEKSCFVAVMDATIREVAAEGESEVSMLAPGDFAEQAAELLIRHGFRVSTKSTLAGTVITATW